ncbi:MAG: hypothetical protein L0H73_02455 [Nitrococcus sp.]|nr:hypothetical protein [Nitrococcus sp.]
MPRPIPAEELTAIVEIVHRYPDGAGLQDIAAALPDGTPVRTLQYRLQRLVEEGQLVREGERRWTRYRLPPAAREAPASPAPVAEGEEEAVTPLSAAGEEIHAYLRKPPAVRRPAGYIRAFLDCYRPNESFYLCAEDRAHLAKIGKPAFEAQPAGTYARQILGRLLIDLSWNSSRLEGNTYSLLDTRRLIEFGEEAEGRDRLEAQMILNHKDAIEFLVGTAEEIGFNRYTILNLHAILHRCAAWHLYASRPRRLRTEPRRSSQRCVHLGL